MSIAEDGKTAFPYAVAGAYTAGTVAGLLELSGVHGDDEEPNYLTPGLVWFAADNVEFQVGVPVGLNDEAADWGAIDRLVLEFGSG